MKAFAILIVALLPASGCRLQSRCATDLYQSYYSSATQDYLTLKLLDEEKVHKAKELAVSDLEANLTHLRIIRSGDRFDTTRQAMLTSRVLKYATEHQVELGTNRFALRMVTRLKGMLNDPAGVRRAADIINFLQTTTTNQLPPFGP